MTRNGCIASDQDEAAVGAARDEASVAPCAAACMWQRAVNLICRTAVYVIRTHGGVGGGGRKVFPYPD